jgi:hypothetical protein
MGDLLNRKELEEWSKGKLTAWTIGDLTRKKLIPHCVIGKRLYLYDTVKIQQWLDNLAAQSMNQSEPGKLRKVNCK